MVEAKGVAGGGSAGAAGGNEGCGVGEETGWSWYPQAGQNFAIARTGFPHLGQRLALIWHPPGYTWGKSGRSLYSIMGLCYD